MNRSRVEQILNRFPGKTILILGDVMLDEFIWGKVRRISPEAPVPVVEVTEETYRLGGSGNVAANIRALDGTPIPIGVIGQDSAGDQVANLMHQSGIDISGLVRNNRPTTVKTRIIAHSQQVVRADRESKQPVSSDVTAEVVTRFLRHLPSASAVIVSDYNKGVVSAKVLSGILPQARSAAVPVFVDPKIEHADYYRPITIITPNQREAELLTGTSISDEASLEQAGHKLLERFGCDWRRGYRDRHALFGVRGRSEHRRVRNTGQSCCGHRCRQGRNRDALPVRTSLGFCCSQCAFCRLVRRRIGAAAKPTSPD